MAERGPQPPRLSLSLPDDLRKKIRLAAALHDMEVGEWCKVVLVQASRKTVEKFYPGAINDEG